MIKETYIAFTRKGLIEFRRILERSRKKLSYKAFYKITGVSIGTLWKLEKSADIKEIRISTLEDLAPHMIFDEPQPNTVQEAVESLRAIATQEFSSKEKQYQTFEEILPILEQLPDEEKVKVGHWVVTRLYEYKVLGKRDD